MHCVGIPGWTPLTFCPPKRPASRGLPEQPPPSKKQRVGSGYSSMADGPDSLPHAEEAEEEGRVILCTRKLITDNSVFAGTIPAALPLSPSSTPAVLPPSPSSSLHSSQVGPDANITAGFEQICKVSKCYPSPPTLPSHTPLPHSPPTLLPTLLHPHLSTLPLTHSTEPDCPGGR